jgi:two-component system chemotaxis sensor kinase CheA
MAVLTPEHIQALFAQEAGIRLTHLDELLLLLEHSPADQDLIRSAFREVHTLKGSAAVAGLEDVSRIAHDLEELMEDVRNGSRSVTPEVVDILLDGADRLRAAISDRFSLAATETADAEQPSAADDRVHQVEDDAVGRTPSHPRPVPPSTALTGRGQHRPVRTAPGDFIQDEDVAPPAEFVDPDAAGVVMVPMERLDELVELLGEAAAAHLRVGRMLKDELGVDPGSSAEFNELSRSLNVLQDRVMRTRMVPVSTITAGLHRAVRDIARTQGKHIAWQVEGAATELDRSVLQQLSDSLLHLVRNCVDHGIETPAERLQAGKSDQGRITLQAGQLGSEVIIAVSDDGRGIDLGRVREQADRLGVDTSELTDDDTLQLIFRSGLSTSTVVTDVSGRGVGLDVVHANVLASRGRIEVRSTFGVGTEFRIIVPITLAVLRCLLVEAGNQRFALPFHRVVLTQAHDTSREIQAEGRSVVWVDDQPVTVSKLAQTLGLAGTTSDRGPIVVLTDTTRLHAFQVDRLVGQRDVALKGLSRLLPPLPAVAGASIEPDGSIFAVLDPPGLIQRARQTLRAPLPPDPLDPTGSTRPRILVVDDALTVRELQRSILQRAGYDVRLATDGRQAMTKLAEDPVDLVLTDIEMPHMDGFELTKAIRAAPALANIPILILSSLSSDVDRQRGLDAGADGFIQKSGFDEASLLASVHRLLGAIA